MSFFTLSNNEQIQASQNYEIEGGDLKPIPSGTELAAAIEEAKYDSYEGDRYINLKWRVVMGDYQNRVIFHKLKVFGDSKAKDSAATADKAKRMLAAIDANAGGKLMALGRKPLDHELANNLCGKVMMIKVNVWEITKDNFGNVLPKEDRKTGNWVCAVAPRHGSVPAQAPARPTAQAAAVTPASIVPARADFFDDVPF